MKLIFIYLEAIEEKLVWFLHWGLRASCDSCYWSVCVHCVLSVHNKGVWWWRGWVSKMIYLLSIPLENEPWIHAKMIKASSIYVLRCQADDCTAGHVQSASGKPWVICMPQIFVHWIWPAEETGIAADIKHGLVPMGSHCHKLTALHQFKNQHQYLRSFFIILGRTS